MKDKRAKVWSTVNVKARTIKEQNVYIKSIAAQQQQLLNKTTTNRVAMNMKIGNKKNTVHTRRLMTFHKTKRLLHTVFMHAM